MVTNSVCIKDSETELLVETKTRLESENKALLCYPVQFPTLTMCNLRTSPDSAYFKTTFELIFDKVFEMVEYHTYNGDVGIKIDSLSQA